MKGYPALDAWLACRIAGAMFLLVLLGSGHALAMAPVERMELPNGMVVLVSEEHSLPFVTFELLVDAGAWRDPPQGGGLANLTAESMLLGTQKRSLTEINEILDYTGTSLDVSCGWDSASFTLKVLKKELEQGFTIFTEILTMPAFPEEEIQREKAKILGSIQSEKDDPMEVARKRFREMLYLKSPYDHPLEGTEESAARLTREQVQGFYRTFYRPNVAILVVVGDITPQEVREKLIPRLSSWEKKEVPETTTVTEFAAGPLREVADRPITQANIVLGHGGIERKNPDYYAVSVMNRILGGGGFSSRLMESIRIRKGLAYSVSSQFSAYRYPGAFQLVLQTKNASASEAIRLAVEEMKRMGQEMVAEQELETAKKYLIGSFPLRLNTQSNLASFIAQAEYYQLGMDYPEKYPSFIGSVTREDVLRVARKYLHPEKAVLSIVGNAKEIGK